MFVIVLKVVVIGNVVNNGQLKMLVYLMIDLKIKVQMVLVFLKYMIVD